METVSSTSLSSLILRLWLISSVVKTTKGKAPVHVEDDEEEELRKLQAEMAM